MEKNYYELLEVSQNASPETIEKVYKILAKKYHPDLQPPEKRAESAEIFKQITIAYETLSDNNLRAEYDKKLERQKNSTISVDDYQKLQQENDFLKNKLNNNSSNSNQQTKPQHNSSYGGFLNNIKHSQNNKNDEPIFIIKIPPLKKLLKILAVVIAVFLIIFILSKIPFVKNYFDILCNKFPFLRILVTVIVSIFQGILESLKIIFHIN